MALSLVTAPAVEPVDLASAKTHLRVDGTDEDVLITALITAAREYCEGFQNRACITQTWDLWLDSFPSEDYIRIPLPPLQSVASVKYYGTDNAEYTMAAADYFVDNKSEPGRLVLAYGKSWPSTTLRPVNGIVVRFTAGHGDATNVPQAIKQAMLLLIGHWYANREAVLTGSISKEIEFAVKSLLWMCRVMPV
ncbi:MAG: head-tail connector protein [Bacillota bacterium]